MAAITEKSLYDTGVTPAYGTQLLTLSTCGDTRIGTDARFALLAVRVGLSGFFPLAFSERIRYYGAYTILYNKGSLYHGRIYL